MSYDNTNTGILSRNDRKEKDTHPDFTGAVNVEGKDYWLNGWIKERKDGSGKFFSLSVKPKEPAPSAGRTQPDQGNASDFDDFQDSDIPF